MGNEAETDAPTHYPWTRAEKVDQLGDGPWIDEPDRLEFRHAGFSCLVRRVPSNGIFCGYVALPPGHPWRACNDHDDVPARAHGGLTYMAPCDEEMGVCHVPEPGESDDVVWLGFDAGHGGMDRIPRLEKGMATFREDQLRFEAKHPSMRVSYKDLPYMRREVERLAEQARDALRDATDRESFRQAFALDMVDMQKREMSADNWRRLVAWAEAERPPESIVFEVVQEIRAAAALFDWIDRQSRASRA